MQWPRWREPVDGVGFPGPNVEKGPEEKKKTPIYCRPSTVEHARQSVWFRSMSVDVRGLVGFLFARPIKASDMVKRGRVSEAVS